MIRLGLQIPSFTYPGVADDELFERIAAQAVAAEESGFDSVFVMDHFYQLPSLGKSTDRMLEAYTLLGALAVRTSTVGLGTLVTGVTYRNPAVLAKIVTTLDVVSRGRAILGIGAAWNAEEHDGYGVAFPPAGERLDLLEDALQICRAMFTQEQSTVTGHHHHTVGAFNNPRPVRPDGIPILVGGGGEKRTLRLVAEYADACNLFGPPDVLRHKFAGLDAHCAAVGRDRAEITRTRLGSVAVGDNKADADATVARYTQERGLDPGMFMAGGPPDIADRIAEYRDAGVEGFIFNMPHTSDPDDVRRAGSVLRPLVE